MKNSQKKGLCLLLALVLVLGLLSGLRLPAAAAGVAINSSNFPDEHFRAYIKRFDADSDGILIDSERTTTGMDCSSRSIASLKGIEFFTGLKRLDCANNQLSTLDFSSNPALEELLCYKNELTSLNVSKNPKLTILLCQNNKLKTLDVSANPLLTRLDCSTNQLRALDTGKNPALVELSFYTNALKSVDVSKNPKLTKLFCTHNYLTALDISKNTKLQLLYCAANQLTELDVSKQKELTQLNCYENKLTELDVSRCTKLKMIQCYSNYLTELRLGSNSELVDLYAHYNSLETLDISGTPEIRRIVEEGCPVDNGQSYRKYALDHNYVTVDQELEFQTVKSYPLKIRGVQVTDDNRADVLGDGAFVFDGARMLTVKGSCKADRIVIDNLGVKDLRIRVLGEASLETYAPSCIRITADTRITGPGKLKLKSTHSSGTGVFVCTNGVKLSVAEAELYIAARNGIAGPDVSGNRAKLLLDHALLSVTNALNGAFYDFGGGITLHDCKISLPAQGSISADGSFLAEQDGSPATMVVINAKARNNPFTDLPSGKYYHTPAVWAYNHEPQITSGATSTTFGPGKECKREQVMTFLWKAAGAPEPETDSCPFTDVPRSKYYYKPILWAVENGITGGVSSTKFGVGKACTRAQVVTFLWKFAGAPEPIRTDCPFTDVSKTKYYYKPVLWALENGITSGTSSTAFGVSKTCTRGQVVTFLYKLMVG